MFKERIKNCAEKNESNLVVALDLVEDEKSTLINKSLELLDKLSNLVCAVKVNRHLLLPLGLFDGVEKIVEYAHNLGLPVIMDCKINDIGSTNIIIAKNCFKAGFDAITVSPYVGWKDGLNPVFDLAHKLGKGVITIVYMSHKGSEDFYERILVNPRSGATTVQYMVFAEKTLEWKADGAIVGATKPEKIGEINKIFNGEIPIYSPGVGFQGGKIEETIRNGAKFLIVGRTIITSENPVKTAETLRDQVLKSLKNL